MELIAALAVALIVNGLILAFLQRRYDEALFRRVASVYVATVAIRYGIALFIWLNYQDIGFARLFWGDSGLYDAMGAAVAEAWSHGGTTETWKLSLEGRVNSGFIYFVAAFYYLFGRNTLLVQLVNCVIGASVSIIILEIGLHLYNRRTALRAMFLSAFFPQMIFWSTALYKDSAVMFCIALNILSLLRLRSRFQLVNLLVYMATAAALVWLRFYVFAALTIATLSGFAIWQKRGPWLSFVSQIAVVGALTILLLLTPVGTEMLATTRYLDLQQLQVSRTDLADSAASGFSTEADVSTAGGILRVLPVGVANLLFAPFPWRMSGLRQALAMPDVLAWYALMPFLIGGIVAAVRFRLGQVMPILVFTTALTLAYGAFLGNVGAAYRQRTQVMMFYFLFISDGLERARARKQFQESRPSEGDSLRSPD